VGCSDEMSKVSKVFRREAMMTDEQYVSRMGIACPFCESTKIRTVDALEAESGCAWQECACSDCGKRWTDQYFLVGFTFDEDENQEIHLEDEEPELPLCVQAMGCYCAGHARGNAVDAPCDTSEEG